MMPESAAERILEDALEASPFFGRLKYFTSFFTEDEIPWGICGGVVRDLIFGYEPNDIDIIVNCPVKKFNKFIEGFEGTLGVNIDLNSFGGLKLEVMGLGKIDVINLSNCWAVRNGYLDLWSYDLRQYYAICNYVIDGAYWDPVKREGDLHPFLTAIKKGRVEVNFEHTPDPAKTLIKGHRLAHKYSLTLGDEVKLSTFKT